MGSFDISARAYKYGAGLIFIAVMLYFTWPPRHVTIETGSEGGDYYKYALQYKKILERGGIQVDLHPIPETAEILSHVDHGTNGVSVGFAAQAPAQGTFPNTYSLGTIEYEPVFIFCRNELSGLHSLADFVGKSIVMPPQYGETTEAALRILGQYGINAENTKITFLPLKDMAEAMHQAQFDVGFIMLGPGNDLIKGLVADPKLTLFNVDDAPALSLLEPSLKSVVIQKNIYNLTAHLPPRDVNLLTASANVIVRGDLHPAIAYALLKAMAEVNANSSLVSRKGQFPNLDSVLLPPLPLATEYYRSGLPIYYQKLPYDLASIADQFMALGFLAVALIGMYGTFETGISLLKSTFHLIASTMARLHLRLRKSNA
jgi:TRAP-type uncharacterized transport system substrate-binding protein